MRRSACLQPDASQEAGPKRSAERFPRHTLASFEREHPARAPLEAYVRRAFALKHGATIQSFMPTLLALNGREERICAVAGIRSATSERLFLERYLTEPIESTLSQQVGMFVPRGSIVEVGNLASMSRRAAFHLIALLPSFLLERGHLWVTFTATDTVRSILAQFNAPVIDLGSANADAVTGLGDEWGRYYERDPRVLAGWLPHGAAFKFSRGLSRCLAK